MSSPRLGIRNAFATTIQSVLPVGTSLSKSRWQPLVDADLPRVVVWMGKDRPVSTEAEDQNAPHQRIVELQAILATLNSDSAGEDQEAATDALALLIEKAVVNNVTLTGTCDRVVWVNTQWDGEVTDKARALCVLDFQALYIFHPE